MKTKLLVIALIGGFIFSSCKTKVNNKVASSAKKETMSFINKGHELIYNMVQKAGNYNELLEKQDVVYTYTYQTPDGKADVSTEKYIFDGELSYGNYRKHERTFPDLEGTIEQGYNGKEYWLKHNGEVINDEKRLKKVAFNRPTNFYWFAMFQKLLDPNLNYEYLKDDTKPNYDIVKVSFNSSDNKPTDIYQVYINKESLLIDYFLFTVADFGVIETPLLMQVSYEEVGGMLIPTKRKYKKSTWNADVDDKPWIYVTWSDIKFNNGLSKNQFNK